MARERPTSRGRRWEPPAIGSVPCGDLRQGESGGVGGETEVAGEGELEAGAEAIALDGDDDGAGEVGERAEGVEGQINVLGTSGRFPLTLTLSLGERG